MNPRRRRTKLLFIVTPCFFLAALLAVSVWRSSHSESIYQGQPMHYWVQKALAGVPASPEAQGAVLALGPPAIRSLLDAMIESDSAWQEKWVQFHPRLPKLFRRIIPAPRSGPDRRWAAYSTLNQISDKIKGPGMRPLVPLLAANLLNDDLRPSSWIVDGETHMAIPHGVYVRVVSAEILGMLETERLRRFPR